MHCKLKSLNLPVIRQVFYFSVHFCKFIIDKPLKSRYNSIVLFRGISAVGSAFEWHSKGQGFDSPMLHHKK